MAGRASRRGVLLALWLVASPAGAEPVHDRDRLEQVRERIEAVQARMRETAGEQDSLTRKLAETEQEIGRIARRLRALEDQLEAQRTRLAGLRRIEAEQLAALDQERAGLQAQIRAAYAMGRQERLKILLNQQDPARVSRLLTYYDYFNRARARRMARIEGRVRELHGVQAELAREEDRLEALLGKELAEEQRLQGQQEARREVLGALAAELRGQSQELDGLRRDERELGRLIADLEAVLSDVPDRSPADERFERRRGQLPWPAAGVIEARYGAPRLGGVRWDGVMIGTQEGGEVRAVHHGRVAFADWLRGFGLLLIIDHGDGWMSLYGHNQTLFKEAGDWVESNEPIALTGSSGGLATPGIYFGIRHQGQPVDPQRWCQRPDGRRVG